MGEQCTDPSDCADNMACLNTEGGTTCQCMQDYLPADDWSCGKSRGNRQMEVRVKTGKGSASLSVGIVNCLWAWLIVCGRG